ncbi:hypothetical protein SAMN04488540_10934 [Ferrimonas sediminum]|uniref:Uncharacterized protein n=1 Tax=Ferrimonas sediminum TaxID=718193 RepID=A0A1G8UBG5_9GAMM|nr:hypothetical protein [Ferrimonas sediminum]SDJ51097.1 hypothetical protein SAMN04488540_10934 [Ferrimonas sediminum]
MNRRFVVLLLTPLLALSQFAGAETRQLTSEAILDCEIGATSLRDAHKYHQPDFVKPLYRLQETEEAINTVINAVKDEMMHYRSEHTVYYEMELEELVDSSGDHSQRIEELQSLLDAAYRAREYQELGVTSELLPIFLTRIESRTAQQKQAIQDNEESLERWMNNLVEKCFTDVQVSPALYRQHCESGDPLTICEILATLQP